MRNKFLLEKVAFYVLFFIPFLVFFLIFHRFALNVPFEDDFGILRNIYDMSVSDDFKVQFKNAISTSNEHPIIISKLFFGLNIWLFKSVNFKALIFVGNAIFLSGFVVFFRLLKQTQLSIWILLPLPYILLSGSTFESGLWAICSFQYNAICGFFIWANYLIFSKKSSPKKFYLGLFLLVCTLVCNGNGILSFLLAGMGLTYQKRWKDLGVVITLLFIIKFFFLTNNYYKTLNPALTTLSSFFILVGGSLKTDSLNSTIQLTGGVITGFISLATLNYVIRRKQHTLEFNVLLLALFSLGSLLGISLFREINSSTFADRYRLYPQFLLICVYLLFVISIPSKTKWLNFSASILGVLYFAHGIYLAYPSMLSGYQKRHLLSVNWATNNSALNGSFYRLFFDETLRFYERDKLYLFEKPIFDIKTAIISKKTVEIQIDSVKNGNMIMFKNIDCSKVSKDNGYYIVLENTQHQFYFLPVLHIRNSLKEISKGQAFFINELAAPIVYAEIPIDTYSVGLLSTINSSLTLFKTNKSVSTHDVGYQQ